MPSRLMPSIFLALRVFGTPEGLRTIMLRAVNSRPASRPEGLSSPDPLTGDRRAVWCEDSTGLAECRRGKEQQMTLSAPKN
jgi:hypothetical protein